MPTPTLPPLPPVPPAGFFVFMPNEWAWLVKVLEATYAALGTIHTAQENLTMATDSLTQAVADLKTEVASHATKIDAELAQLLAAQGAGDQAAIDAAAQSIRDTTASLQGLDVSLDADDAAPASPVV